MSVALRHDPASFNLSPDPEGWAPLEKLAAGIRQRAGWHWVQPEHICEVVDTSDKQRFEIRGELIRARYGHSKAARPTYEPVLPPAILYHGTPRRNVAAIRQNGLQAMSRQYVHLTATPEMARQVGQRRDPVPVILRVRAAAAHAAGIRFGTPSGSHDEIYLVESVPPEFIELAE